jgi:serine/threonine protein kinase/Flp pilus assembly protein TadD
MDAVLSHYRVLEQIGAGGMGVVYRAHDEHLDCDVALKVLQPGRLADESARKRFRKEALALSKLNHPNIAVVHDFDTQDGTDFLVQEFIPGLLLSEMLTSGPLTEREIVNLGSQLADGLAAAHEQGIVHCDLKPANIRVTPDVRLKILDFGLARIVRPSTPTALTVSETRTLSFAGTLPYMAPEQLLTGNVDPRTDVWAAGCVLYEMGTGRAPFLGFGPALSDAILHQPAPLIRKLNPNVSEALEAIIQKCLDKDPDRRYCSARELAVDLRRADSAPRFTGTRLRIRRRASMLAIVVTLTAILGAGLFVESTFRKSSAAKQAVPISAHAVPHESYLLGLKQLERWDEAGNIDRAIANFSQAVETDPAFALGYSALAEAYWAKYRLDHDSQWIPRVELNCRRAATLNNQLPAVYVILARVHNGQGEYNLALQEIQQALKLEPRDPDALLGEASVYASLGRVQEAESLFKKATALRPQHWGGRYELGVFYYRQKRYADAAAEFRKAIDLTPDNAIVHATLGGMMQLLHQNDEAEKELQHSLALQPSYVAYTNLGALYYQQRRWAESAGMTRKALQINSKDFSAWANLGMAYEWLNQQQASAEAYHHELVQLEQIAKVSSDDAAIQAELALLYSRFKLREKAIPRLEAALALAPEDPAILAGAAECYEYLGDRTRALKFIEQALAKGLTVDQMEIDPGLRNLIVDRKFRRILSNSRQSSPAQPFQ